MKNTIMHDKERLVRSLSGDIEAHISLDEYVHMFSSDSVIACLDFFTNIKRIASKKIAEYPDVIHWNSTVNIAAVPDERSYVIISTGGTEVTLIAPSAGQLLELLDAVANRQMLCRADQYINASASYAAKCIRSSASLKCQGEINKKIFIRDFIMFNKK